MSANAVLRPSHGTPPLMVLAALLENAHLRDDPVVSFPANTSDAIIHARPRGTQYDLQQVEAIVLALDSYDSRVCGRLDSLSLIILCSIFIYSQECLAQQRGLCLIARVLHRTERDTAQELAQKLEKKEEIGRFALTQLIKGFLKTDASEKLRRWLGILALELLKNCPKNVGKLQSDPPEEKHWQYLGEVIEHGSCQVLKLLAGSMIREMLSSGVLPDEFWQSKTCSDLYPKFPKGKHHNSQWVTSFEEYVDELVLQKILIQEVSSVIFAYAVYVGDRKWNLKQALDILVTVSKELNIVIPANEVNPAVYIDVPLDSISDVSLNNALEPDSQQPMYGVVIQLDGSDKTNCIFNATESTEHHLALAFSSQKDANTLRRLLMPKDFQANGVAPYSQSGVTDASEQMLSDDELAAPHPALSDNRMLLGTASFDNTVDSNGNIVGTVNPSMLERANPPQRAPAEHRESSSDLMVEDDGNHLLVGHSVEIAAEGIDVSQADILVEQAIEGIDVSQVDGPSYGEIQNRSIQATVMGNLSSDARIQESQALRDGKLNSKGYLNTDPNAIQNAPQYRAQLSQEAVPSVKPGENKRNPYGQVGKHDDLYYASPKVTKDHQRSPSILAQDKAPKNLERPLESTIQQTSAKGSPLVKLSRQLRNADGVVELRTERTADDELTILTKNDPVDAKASANGKKSRAPARGKAGRKIKNATHHGKQTAQSKRKAVATEELRGDSSDAFDLPLSPKRRHSTIKPSLDKEEASSTWLKATKSPRDMKPKAKPVPTKAPTTASSIKSVPNSDGSSKKEAAASASHHDSLHNRSIGQKVDDDAIWDIDQAHGEEGRQTLRQSRQSAKTAEKQDAHKSKSKKKRTHVQPFSNNTKVNKPPNAHNQEPGPRLSVANPTPVILSRSRPQRAAAIKANKRIQGLEKYGKIVDNEQPVPTPTRSKRPIPLVVANRGQDQKAKNGGDERQRSSGKLPTRRYSTKDFISDSVSPDASDSVSDLKADSGPEKINSTTDGRVEALRAAAGGLRNNPQKGKLTRTVENLAVPLHPKHDEVSFQRDRISSQQVAKSSEAGVYVVPDAEPKSGEHITEIESARVSSQSGMDVKQGHIHVDGMNFSGDQNQVERAALCTDGRPFELKPIFAKVEENFDRSQAPTASMTVSIGEKSTSPRFAGSARKSPIKPKSTRWDPFVSKLNASMPQAIDTKPQVKSSKTSEDADLESKGPNTSRSAGLERPSRDSETRALGTPGAASSSETKQVGRAREILKSSVQVVGEGECSSAQPLEAAGENPSVLGLDMKRKNEQKGDSSNKRVKVVPNEQLGRVPAKTTSGFDAEKTPPPAVSNKPLVIGFSASGPRNQGTISTKKSETAKDVGNSSPDPVKSRKQQAPHDSIDRAGADFTSNQEGLEPTSEEIHPSLKITGIVEKQDRDPLQQKQAEHNETVNVVATGEAQRQKKGAEKRKLAPLLDDTAPSEHEQPSKRQKRQMRTPHAMREQQPTMLPDIGPALVHDRSQRLSSQKTRVTENGSPMPFFINRNDSTKVENQYTGDEDGKDALAKARLEEPSVLQDDDMVLPETIVLPRRLVSAVSASQQKAKTYQSLSNNSKQVPSSPHASSTFGTMPPHHLYHNGEIVNAETKKTIVPSKPQDPFSDPFADATHKPPNAFIDALRRSTEFAARSLVSCANDSRKLDGVVKPRPNVGEDPDKTLVEPYLRNEHRQVHVSDKSSNSQADSSTQASQLNEPPGEDSEAEAEVKWRKGLEPHQGNLLECLFAISHHLIRHLIDKETAVEDMVTDFANQGDNLVKSYEKARQERIDSHKAYNDWRRLSLVKILQKAQTDAAATSKAVTKRHIQHLDEQWKTHQEDLMRKMTTALEACAE